MTARTPWAALALGASLALPHPHIAAASGETEVKTAACSVVAAGDAINNTINCTFGFTPEKMKELVDAATRGATGPLTDTIVELSKRLGVAENAAKTLLSIVGERNVPPERLSETLNRVASDYKRMQMQLAALNSSDPTVRSFVDRAKAKISEGTAGDFKEAHQLLMEATRRQIEAAQQARAIKQQANAAEDADLMGAAASTATEGRLALTERHYQVAANLFKQAAELVPAEHRRETADYLEGAAVALYRQGDEFGDNAALASSISILEDALRHRSRDRVSLAWAITQANLAVVLEKAGERETGTVRLEEAVAADRAALAEMTRERAPLNWAMTQVNLGNALCALDEHENGSARLEEAVAAYRAALEVETRDRVPRLWAAAQTDLGTALQRLGEREIGTARLKEAVVAYRAALEEETRDRLPLAYAKTQMNLGAALSALGERENETTHLEETVKAYRAALEEGRRDRVPLVWATIQMDLCGALRAWGERDSRTDSGTEHLEEAVAACRAALEERTRGRAPLDWAAVQFNLGNALDTLGERRSGTMLFCRGGGGLPSGSGGKDS